MEDNSAVSESISRIATLMAHDSDERTPEQHAELMQLKATLDEVIAIRDDVNEIVQAQTKRSGLCEMNKLAEILHLRGYRKGAEVRPQVFLPGDVLPTDVAVLNTSGVLYGPAPGWVVSVPGVAIPLPTSDQVETLVERAQDQREAA